MKLLILSAILYSAAAITVDFEDQSGTTPSGSISFIEANCNGTGTATIDSTTVHGGKKSLKVTGAAGYCNHVYVGFPVSGLSTLYARVWLRHSTALPANHVAFIAMKDSNDGGRDLRIGGQNQALQWNRESDDATLPEQSPNGVAQSIALPTNAWVCLEFKVGSDGTAQTWVDGKEVPGLHAGDNVADIDRQWSAKTWRPQIADFRVGWESYGEGADTFYYDDIVVQGTKVGC